MRDIAFYAPLKSPHHPVPSGEREMARNLMLALQSGGASVTLVSDFRPLDKVGDAAQQARLIAEAEAVAAKLIAQGGWSAWVTYHSYYKAPDLLGPLVCDALRIPYVSIEATRAAKRLAGPWAAFERKAAAACDRADVLFHVTQRDAQSLREHLKSNQKLVHLAPFLGAERLPAVANEKRGPVMVAGMMRQGDKMASYEIVAQVLAKMTVENWTVEIAGDGPARPRVEALMRPFGAHVRFLGQLDADQMAAAYERAAAFLWPGVNEAFGMVYLEAQSHGVPVVAEQREGVCDVVCADGLFEQNAPQTLAAELGQLLNAPDHHAARALVARQHVASHHLLGAAGQTLWDALEPLISETE